jgi:sigma-E factor negative regulatory protein RseC
MESIDCIKQKGIIEEIKNGIAKVHITNVSACASCHAKGSCGMSESADMLIDVAINNDNFHKGEFVTINMEKSLGLKATFIAYVLPFIIILAALIALTSAGINEIIAGLISLGILTIYYIALHFFKDRLQKTFQFTLNKVN